MNLIYNSFRCLFLIFRLVFDFWIKKCKFLSYDQGWFSIVFRKLVIDSHSSSLHLPNSCGAMNLNNLRVCNQHLPTALFEQSCNKTLCEYPEIDNVRCSILAGYAKACEMKANIVLGDWWTAAGCRKTVFHFHLYMFHDEMGQDGFEWFLKIFKLQILLNNYHWCITCNQYFNASS